jgi:callose synthase
MAAYSGGKDRDLNKRMGSDPYFSYAIRECYVSFKNIINTLVFGRREKVYVYFTIHLVTSNPCLVLFLSLLLLHSDAHFSVMQEIFAVVDKHVNEGTLINDLNMWNLPALSKKLIELLELLV